MCVSCRTSQTKVKVFILHTFFSLSGLEVVTILQSLSYKRLLKIYRWQEWENDLLLPGGKERGGGGGNKDGTAVIDRCMMQQEDA